MYEPQVEKGRRMLQGYGFYLDVPDMDGDYKSPVASTDVDILFPLVPHDQILVKWLGYSEPAKLGSFWWFSRFLSVAEIFSQTIFSKITPFKDETT